MPINNFRNITTTGFDEDALVTTTDGDQVRNFAVVTTTGDLANGVYAGADNVSINNFGKIETGGTGAEGVLIEGAGARVRNFGSVVTHGEPTDDFLHFNDAIAVYGGDFRIENWGNLSTQGDFSQGVFALGDGGLIRNFGSVSTSGDFCAAIGVGDGSQLVNFDVENWGRLETQGNFSNGVFAIGDGGLIRNFGSISTSGVISSALVAAGDGNRIVNFGDIRVEDPLGFALAMDATGSQNEVVNFGTITGAGMFAGAIDIVLGSGNTATNWGIISSDHVDFAMLGTGRGALAQNFGTIEAFVGIGALGDLGPQARNTGTIITQADIGDGLTVGAGTDGEAVNTGSIRTEGDGASGVFIISSIGGQVTNSGSIETFGGVFGTFAAAGVDAHGLNVLVQNIRTGSIETHDPNSPAVSLNIRDIETASYRPGVIAADTQSRLENEGLIEAAQTAVLGGAGDETVINHGRIVGDVRLGEGDDTFVFGKGGVLVGDLLLGEGDDIVRIENGSSTSAIADFAGAGVSGGDAINVSAFFSTIDELKAESVQSGSDVVVALDRNDTLVLANVQLSTLNSGDFIFV